MRYIILFIIKLYQKLISPFLGANCRFYPTCSAYCAECFEKLPLHKAIFYSITRIGRCHPYSKGGSDPVPECREDNE